MRSAKGTFRGLSDVAKQKLQYATQLMFDHGHGDVLMKALKFTRAKTAKAFGYYPYFIPFDENNSTEVYLDGKKIIMVGSNNYLGLTNHPEIIEAGKNALEHFGSSLTGSRFLNGNLRLHEELETRIAEFVGKPSALVFSTGFSVNTGVISTLCGRDDIILSDSHNHASIIEGVLLSRGKSYRYHFRDLDRLKMLLESLPSNKGRFLVSDGIFSMEGAIVDLPGLVKLKKKYKFRIMIDDAHSIGVLGNGRGTAHHFNLVDDVDLIMGTFSKSLAGVGGFIAGEEFVIDFLKHSTRPFIFTASLPPVVVACVGKALEIIKREPERVHQLWENAQYMLTEFKNLGFNTWHSESPVIPIVIGEDMKTFTMWRRLFEAGIYTNPIVAPAVPKGYSLIRTSYMATHSREQLDFILETFKKVGRDLEVI